MKKVLSLVFLCFVIALLTTGCQTDNIGLLPENDFKIEATPEEYFTFNEETGTITGYDTDGGLDVVIPSTINGVDVEHIGDYAFKDNYLISVTIPYGVTSIGYSAFSYNDLASVNLPESLTDIAKYSFMSNKITSIDIPDSVTNIGFCAFVFNYITSITIGAEVDIDRSNGYTMGHNLGFMDVYDNFSKTAGTYIYHDWCKWWHKVS